MGRYAPAKPVRRSETLSKESLLELGGRPRKLGTTLGLVCSDARSVSRDIISQCATYFVHRLTSQTEIDTVTDVLPEEMPMTVMQSMKLGIDVNRHKEIVVKAVSAILLLLLKHFKVFFNIFNNFPSFKI